MSRHALSNALSNCFCPKVVLSVSFFLAGTLISVAPSHGQTANYWSVCESWAEQRDQMALGIFEDLYKDYERAIDGQALWAEHLADINSTNPEFWLKAQGVADILLVGVTVTVDTLRIATDLAGVSISTLADVDLKRISLAIEAGSLLGSSSPEYAAAHLIGRKSNVVKLALSSLSITNDLIAARDRFADRNDAIALVHAAQKKISANAARSKSDLNRTRENFDALNVLKNSLDKECAKVSPDASQCVSITDSDDDEASVLRNNCSKPVHAFWCQAGPSTATNATNLQCGGRNFFRKQKILDAGSTETNRYSLPTGKQFQLGGCFGARFSAAFAPNGSYYCISR